MRLVVVTDTGVWDLEASEETFAPFRSSARDEGRKGFVSTPLVNLLEAGKSHLVLEAEVAKLGEQLREAKERKDHELNLLQAKGQYQARAVLASNGKIVGDEVDAIPFALGIVARTLGNRVQLAAGSAVITVGAKVKPRTKGHGTAASVANNIEHAVVDLRERYGWPILPTGVSRLNPRSKDPITCVGLYVRFDGFPQYAIVWPFDMSSNQSFRQISGSGRQWIPIEADY